MALLIGAALLVAQLVNFALILNERQKLSLAQNQGPAIARFVNVATDVSQAPAEFRFAVLQDASRRGAHFAIERASHVPGDADRASGVEARTRQSLASAGVAASEVRAAFTTEQRPERRGRGGRMRGPREVQLLLLSAQLPGGEWLNGRINTPPPDPLLTARLIAATLLLYLIVLGATLLIARRLARPLRDLTKAAERFGGREAPAAVEPRGPADLKRAIDAFNAMNRRVVALLDEKDRMLGAIGHDLRTPLASLRIRAESVEPASERERMIATIDEMNAMLEDILVLARSGRAREAARPMDVTALADALVEEYRELGHDAALEPSERQVLAIQPNLMRRAIRNLIDNAVKYGGSARVAVRSEGDAILIEVRDRGPGLAPDQLGQVLEPFYRVEESRSRETGGTGLGLAIARAIAESHGGELRLANAPDGGLSATIRLPAR
jgi:signal transduction histidine kinase